MTAAERIRQEIEEFDLDEYEYREGECETDIPPLWSRHYESKSVARQLRDGTWVGWTYWYGGGKHGDPDSIPWIEDSYFLKCTEKQELVTVRTFERVDK